MTWVAVAVVVGVALLLFFKGKGGPTVRQSTREGQRRISELPPEEKIKAEAALRETAGDSYDTGFANARNAGKDDSFAHQVGVLNAVSAILLQRNAANNHETQEMQGETVPFNLLPLDEGRAAIIEYLVWKFLPERADEAKFSPALAAFRTRIFEEAERENDSDLAITMIYICRYDWQRYIADKLGPRPDVGAG